jgi:hypothetical protein
MHAVRGWDMSGAAAICQGYNKKTPQYFFHIVIHSDPVRGKMKFRNFLFFTHALINPDDSVTNVISVK